MRIPIPILFAALLLPAIVFGQSDSTASTIPEKAVKFVNDKYDKLNAAIDKQTMKMLEHMQRREAKLQKKLQGIDSTKAAELFANSQERYQALEQKLQTPVAPNITNPLKQYIPGLDSLQTAISFLGQYGGKLQQLQGASAQIQQLQGTLQQANEIQSILKDREQELQGQLSQYNFGGQLLGMNKQLYYYQQQMAQYKALANDPEKLGEAILSKVSELPTFQNFFQKNSYLAQLFGTPQNYGSPASIAGLQTMAQVQQLMAQRAGGAMPGIPAGGSSGQAIAQQQMQGAQQQLNQLQNNVSSLGGGGGNSDAVMPDFKPNTEKTKTFLKRLEYGFNIQNTQATSLAPSISTLGLTVGYKFSQKATAGIGASYMLGLGRPINDIKFTNEGIGLRTYVDIKAKGSFWLTGGMEANYYQTFSKLSEVYKNVSAWQQSALLGMTKKYKISNNKQGNLQLLYDFLYRQHIPVSQPLVFRMGYNF